MKRNALRLDCLCIHIHENNDSSVADPTGAESSCGRRRAAVHSREIPRNSEAGHAPLDSLAVLAFLLASARGETNAPTKDVLDLAAYDAKIKPADRQHWAYQPVNKPAVPKVRDRSWVRNPIDAFVLAGLEEKSWRPAAPAEPRVLLRRIYLDLTGLPPTLAEQDAFLTILRRPPSTASCKTYCPVDLRRTLGRHWLDLVRYAESNGYERDSPRPFVWRYRDYVIKAFNDDNRSIASSSNSSRAMSCPMRTPTR